MKRLLIAATASLFAATAPAAPLYHPMGPNLTFGDVAHGQSIMAGINNPAAGATAIRDAGDTVQFGIWTGIGGGVEVGKVDNLYDTIDAQVNKFNNTTITGDPTTDISTTVDSLNDTLRSIDQDGSFKGFISVHLPIVPLIVSSDFLGGTLVFDGHVSAETNAHVLQQDILFTSLLDPNDDINYTTGDTSFSVDNDTTLLVKAAANTELSLGYSRQVMDTAFGKLYAGVRGKYLRVGLIRANERLGNVTDSQNTFDNIDSGSYTDTTGIGLDAGVILIAPNYRVGASINNINEPSFDFNDFTKTGYDPTSQVYSELAAGGKYVMEKQLKLEGALYTENQNWVISVGMDGNAAADALGDDYQWATVSAAYVNTGFILPGIRFGLRNNLAGTKLSYLTGGFTLFGALNLDLAYATDTVKVDGSDAPRGVMLNIGLDITF